MLNQPELIGTDGISAKELRNRLGMSQTAFWQRVVGTQSAGRLYENKRRISARIAYLLHLAYGMEAQATALLQWLRQAACPPALPCTKS
ncbi:MAG: XRE family transcriptional regulator [Azonexaceae bacterium]|nr:XRE family transcriptional regulator [Azonexaceae bacterium]